MEPPTLEHDWNTVKQSLERKYYIGQGYRTLTDADPTTVGVCVQDVSLVACETLPDRVPVLSLYSASGYLLAALPWPEDVYNNAAAIGWWLSGAVDGSW